MAKANVSKKVQAQIAAAYPATAAQGFSKADFAAMFAKARAEFNLSKDGAKALKKALKLKLKIAKLKAQLKALEAEAEALVDSLKIEIGEVEARFSARIQEILSEHPEAQAAYAEFCENNRDKNGLNRPLIEEFAVDGIAVNYKNKVSNKFQQAEFKAKHPEKYAEFTQPQVTRPMTIK